MKKEADKPLTPQQDDERPLDQAPPVSEKPQELHGDKKLIDDLTNTCKRVQADFENYQKRSQKEMANRIQGERVSFMRKLLPTLDSFEQALKNTKNPDEFKRGMEMIHAQLTSFLDQEGLRTIESKGKRFDPYRHEVLMQEESDQDDIVLEELQTGYMLGDQVLRHAKVKIGKKRSDKK